MLGLVKKMFTGLLASHIYASNHTKCMSLSNQKCMIPPTAINLHPKAYQANVNVNLIVENVNQIKNGIMTNVGVSAKMIIYEKKILCGTRLIFRK